MRARPGVVIGTDDFRNDLIVRGGSPLENLYIVDNVEIPLLYRRLPGSRRRALAQAALERVGLGSRLHHFPSQLSGGQQQRVAIARAIVGQPRILLADEPTGNLDSKSSHEIMSLFQRLNERSGITVVVVTHDSDVAAWAGRTIVLADGRVVAERREATGGES